jgi:predicted esterase
MILHPKNVEHKWTLIALHGTNCEAFKNFFLKGPFPVKPFTVPEGCRIVIPKSPWYKRKVNTIHSWFDITKDYHGCEPEDLVEPTKYISKLLDEEIKVLGDSKKVFLGGFNQGGTVSLDVYLRTNHILGGVFSCSGFCLCKKFDWENIDVQKKKLTPIFMRHGEEDYNIRAVQGKSTYDVMSSFGIDHWTWDLEADVSRTYT